MASVRLHERMKKLYPAMLLCIAAFLAGCATRSARTQSALALGTLPARLSDIDGTYGNSPNNWTNAPTQFHLWERLHEDTAVTSQPHDVVLFNVDTESRIRTQLCRNTTVLADAAISYRRQPDHLEIKPVLRTVFRFPFWGFGNSLTDIAFDGDGDLHVFNDSGGTALLVVAPMGGASDSWHGEYKKIKTVEQGH